MLIGQWLQGRPNLKKIIVNISWLVVDRVIRMGAGLLVGIWVARYLGPEQFGRFNYAYAFVALFTAFSTLGLESIVVRDIVREPDGSRDTLGSTFLLRLSGGLMTLALTMVIISLVSPDDGQVRWLVGIIAAGTAFQAFETIDYWFQAQVQSKYTVWARNTAFILASLVRVVLIFVKAPLIAFAWAVLLEAVLGALGMIFVYHKTGQSLFRWRWNPARGKELLKDSWPLILSGLVIMVYMRIDQIMLKAMVGDKEVGIYSVAVRLAEVWYFIPGVIVFSVFPKIVETKKISDQLFYERLQNLYNLMALLGYAVAVPTAFLANWVVGFLYGREFLAAGPMLAVLIWGGLFTNLGIARSSFLTTMNWTKVHFMTTSVGCVINVAMNLILIPRYGGLGAALASVIAYWFAAHGACFLYKPLFKTGIMLSRALIFPVPRGKL